MPLQMRNYDVGRKQFPCLVIVNRQAIYLDGGWRTLSETVGKWETVVLSCMKWTFHSSHSHGLICHCTQTHRRKEICILLMQLYNFKHKSHLRHVYIVFQHHWLVLSCCHLSQSLDIFAVMSSQLKFFEVASPIDYIDLYDPKGRTKDSEVVNQKWVSNNSDVYGRITVQCEVGHLVIWNSKVKTNNRVHPWTFNNRVNISFAMVPCQRNTSHGICFYFCLKNWLHRSTESSEIHLHLSSWKGSYL